MERKEFTGLYDDNDAPIYLGDTLTSEYGYSIIVCKYDDNILLFDNDPYYGKLLSEDNSLRDIPYALNNGKGYKVK